MSSSFPTTAFLAWLSQVRMHSPQSMQRASLILACPSVILMASVGHLLRQFVQPVHLFTSSFTECSYVLLAIGPPPLAVG